MVKDIFTEDALTIYIKELLSILGKNPRNNLDRITLDVISRCIFQIILYGNQEDSDYYLNELKLFNSQIISCYKNSILKS